MKDWFLKSWIAVLVITQLYLVYAFLVMYKMQAGRQLSALIIIVVITIITTVISKEFFFLSLEQRLLVNIFATIAIALSFLVSTNLILIT